MADNVVVTAGTGTTVAADEVVDGTLGTVKVQFVKIMDATLDGTTKAAVGANGLAVDVKALPTLAAVTTVSTVTNLSQLGGAAIAMGTGVRSAGTQRVTVATDDVVPVTGTLTAVTAISNALPAGTNLLGKVGIDQTTDGTTNKVAADIRLAGTAAATGSGAMNSATQRIAMATDSPGVIATAAPGTLSAAGPSVTAVNPSNYETVAASQTAQALGATGATGDFINGLLVIPATTSPGNVLLLDNATSITVFTGGATSVSNLVPFFIPLGMTSVSGAWKVTTGSNVSAIGIGKFT